MKKIRLVIADDHPVVIEGLRAILFQQKDMEIMAEADSGEKTLALASQWRPDVVLMDMSMPGISGIRLIQQLRRQVPQSAVLAISINREEQYTAPAIRAGAQGFIAKSRQPQDFVDAIRQVARGQVFISAELAQRIAVDSLQGRTSGLPHESLTVRERQIMVKLAQGKGVSDIAKLLHLSPKTVSTHKTHILDKMGLNSIADLVRYAITYDLQ